MKQSEFFCYSYSQWATAWDTRLHVVAACVMHQFPLKNVLTHFNYVGAFCDKQIPNSADICTL